MRVTPSVNTEFWKEWVLMRQCVKESSHDVCATNVVLKLLNDKIKRQKESKKRLRNEAKLAETKASKLVSDIAILQEASMTVTRERDHFRAECDRLSKVVQEERGKRVKLRGSFSTISESLKDRKDEESKLALDNLRDALKN
jgi:predicted ribosome quality control (RQC) complex YloA/Tae2 family protein